ncbi:unnamed protein product [Nippostrongylus brasiliensis]|uniref:WSC domain-containing protein n=1 Tax=Nippostrongylus brasiliensis TaxID=27835 RepID=A0A0N4YK09_NIPBR|nr:unnamed protein product [Nippostrongylus brasiliensis]
MRQLYPLVNLLLLETTIAFTVLPYIQIDYAHYFHLAQCQAKCAEKYGTPSSRQLLDGSAEDFLNVRNANCEACDSGCHQHRRANGKAQKSKVAIIDGHRFWNESSAETGRSYYLF